MIHHSYLPTFPVLDLLRRYILHDPTATKPTASPYTILQIGTMMFAIAGQLLSASHSVRKSQFGMMAGGGELEGKPVALLAHGAEEVIGALGTWLSGGSLVSTKSIDPTETAREFDLAKVQIILVSPEENVKRHAQEVAARMLNSPLVVIMDLAVEKPVTKSYKTHPPIYMIQEWDKNAPRPDAHRSAIIASNGRHMSHLEIGSVVEHTQPAEFVSSLGDILKAA